MLRKLEAYLPAILFVLSIAAVSFFYGFSTSMKKRGLTYEFIEQVIIDVLHTGIRFGFLESLSVQPTSAKDTWSINESSLQQPGLTMITSVEDEKTLSIRVFDQKTNEVHRWEADFWKIWPNPEHLTEREKPKSPPGGHIHGNQLLSDGSIVFNFEHLGLVRLNACGEVIWKLPYRTHHSVFLAEDDTLWVSAQKNHADNSSHQYANVRAPFIEEILLQVSQDGEILQEVSVFELLIKNGYEALLHMSNIHNDDTSSTDDILHLNDIEVFPSTMQEGIFKHGDIMISLRNIHSVIIFNAENWSVRAISTGQYIRQHDPDFIDGNTISVYDNNNLWGYRHKNAYSKIVIQDFKNQTLTTYYGEEENEHFYSHIMGKNQWLDNGNLLITSSNSGRVIEVTPEKQIVMEFFNIFTPGKVGIVEEAYRLPPQYNTEFFTQKTNECKEPL